MIKRGAADLKQVRSLAPPAHFNARKWFQHISLLLKAGAFERLATDAATFEMLVEFDVITEIGGAHVLDKRAKTTATETTELATETLLAIASRDRMHAQIRARISDKPDELFASSYRQPYAYLPEEVVARFAIATG